MDYDAEMSITTYIYEDLKARLNSGREIPTALTLEALSEHYDVSFSPVRNALKRLIDEGLVTKGKNRRLSATTPFNKRRRPSDQPSLPAPPRDMYEVISRDFVKLSLKGKAINLREEVTAQKYGISRSSLRIIFNRLAGAGLIEHIPRCGWRLRPFLQQDMHDFLVVRELLELKALEMALPFLEELDLLKILSGNVLPRSDNEAPRIDNSLHQYFIEKGGNVYIKDFFQRHGRFYNILFDWEELDRKAALETVEQHQAILRALLDKDWERARQALAFHIHNNHPILNKL